MLQRHRHLGAPAQTRSGKTLRKTLCKIANGQEYVVASTIDDPVVIPEIIEVLRGKQIVK